MLVRVDGKRSNSVVKALIRQAGRLPEGMMPSLTWSRNDEQATHKRFVIGRGRCRLCDRRIPWERANNEDANGLLR